MLISHAILLSALPPASLEDFVKDWLAQRCKDYHSHELWRGTDDKGRDVTGYVTDKRMEGAWDNFQCKQLSKPLSELSTFVELGKIFMHSANGEYRLPRSYTFVAPKGAVRNVRMFIAHPDRFKAAFLSRWDAEISGRLVENRSIKLTDQIRAKIDAFNFSEIHLLDAMKLVDDHACKPALVKWFGEDPGPSPKGTVPNAILDSESAYISQLLKLYDELEPGAYPNAAAGLASPTFGSHLREQRTRFFDSVAFDKFYRDSTPEDYLDTFKDEIYHGVVDTHRDEYTNGLAKHRQVMKQAANLHLTGVLGKHASPQVKQGTCHQFANDGRLPWNR